MLPAKQIKSKIAALEELFQRVGRIASAQGGTCTRFTDSVNFCGSGAGGPVSEPAPAVLVSMTDGFNVVLTPTTPLSVGHNLMVRAHRNYRGHAKGDRCFTVGPTGWQLGPFPLTDREIRDCLLPDAPPSRF